MIIGDGRPAVILSAETAYYIEKLLKPQGLRLRAAEAGNHMVVTELHELRRAALDHQALVQRRDECRREGLLPEAEGVSAEGASGLRWVSTEWLSSVEAADLAGVTDSAVRLACRQGRLDARRVGGRWQITRAAAEKYRATINAA